MKNVKGETRGSHAEGTEEKPHRIAGLLACSYHDQITLQTEKASQRRCLSKKSSFMTGTATVLSSSTKMKQGK
ncbi:hypothetical protein PO124_13460 [Bacillus licheniformis]|nr:hypothetical protein [Bacillus licheniformis]